jgi:hypothetical protein
VEDGEPAWSISGEHHFGRTQYLPRSKPGEAPHPPGLRDRVADPRDVLTRGFASRQLWRGDPVHGTKESGFAFQPKLVDAPGLVEKPRSDWFGKPRVSSMPSVCRAMMRCCGTLSPC